MCTKIVKAVAQLETLIRVLQIISLCDRYSADLQNSCL